MPREHSERFFIAPFACDGESLGIGEWNSSNLESTWLNRLRFLTGPDNYDHRALPSPFSDFSVRATLVEGSGIATFFVRDVLATSAVILTGARLDAEFQILNMFLDSVRRVSIVAESGVDSRMDRMIEIANRPLMIAIPWPDDRISDDEYATISAISIHFAALSISQQIR